MTTTTAKVHHIAPSGEMRLAAIIKEEGQRNDGWQNTLTGIGMMNRDKRLAMRHEADAPLGPQELEGMFHGDDVVRRICELVPREMVREWIEIVGDPDGKMLAKMDELGIRQGFHEGQTWARLWGGAIMILGADDGQTLDKPLSEERIKSFDWVTVLDRWDVQIHSRYADATQRNYDEPATYRVSTGSVSLPATGLATLEAIIHESRVIRFDGAMTSRRRKRLNFNGWSQSIIDTCYSVVRDFNQAFHGVSNLLTDFSQAVIKIKNLAQMLSTDKDNLIVKRMKYLDLSRSIARAVMLDADGEEFTRETTALSGVSDVIDRICQRLSAATDIPMTLLMGESPAGMNATGESDHRFFYNVVKNEQETRFRPPLTKLLRILGKVLSIKPSDAATGNFSFSFKSLWQASEADTEETRLKVAQRDQIYFNMGGLDANEIIISRFGGDKYSTETTIDLKQAPAAANPDNVDPELLPPPLKGAPAGAPAEVQKSALNGVQVTALQAILTAVGDKSLMPGAAIIMIGLSYPDFDAAEVKKMVDEQSKVEPPKPPPAPIIAPHPGLPIPKPAGDVPPVDAPKPPAGE